MNAFRIDAYGIRDESVAREGLERISGEIPVESLERDALDVTDDVELVDDLAAEEELVSLDDIEDVDDDDDDERDRQDDVGDAGGDYEGSDPVVVAFEEAWLDEAWDDLDASGSTMRFDIEGDRLAVHQTQAGAAVVTEAQGIVKRIEEDRMLLGTPGLAVEVAVVRYRLPASLDLRALVGRRARVTLTEEPDEAGHRSQTFVVHTADDRVWLVAQSGFARDASHTLGGAAVKVTLAPVGDGPVVVCAPGARHVLETECETRMRIGGASYVAELVSRDDAGTTYFIADDLLWH